ncbi:MAG: GntP family permease [Methanolobus sp.]|uniref:GntP family permease n=1 Tax=Methanolobus sp. TaxID=1874737 RepID=UPI0027308AAE|nr:GntP family permease [Methanolobus sp.]MDP2217262.1 GntP family permease [Methanolobus sp.]
MNPLIIFFIALAFILILTARLRIHPFLSLIAGSLLVGLLAGEAKGTMDAISTGMGRVFAQFAIVITAGSIIGTILHRTGGTALIAEDIISLSKKPFLSLNMLGFIFSVPLMCCILAYVIFIPVAREISTKLSSPRGVAATSLGLGTLASFSLVYPSPVVYPAMVELGIVRTEVLLTGFIIAFTVSIIGYLYAIRFCRLEENKESNNNKKMNTPQEKEQESMKHSPGRIASYAPLVVPIILILAGIFIAIPPLDFIGTPNVALLIGVILSMVLPTRGIASVQVREWIEKGIRRGGVVLLDMCGGGALGATLALTGAGQAIGNLLLGVNMPVLFIPFLIAAAIQSVQGSRVVTMLVSLALVMPVMPQLGLPAEIVLFSMASGTLLISHFNDPFFWIFGDLAEMETLEILKTYTAGGIIMGISSLFMTATIYFLFY